MEPNMYTRAIEPTCCSSCCKTLIFMLLTKAVFLIEVSFFFIVSCGLEKKVRENKTGMNNKLTITRKAKCLFFSELSIAFS